MQIPTVDPITLLTLLIIAFFLLWLLSQAIKIVPEYKRLVVFRLGRYLGVRGPGMVFLIPVIDKPVEVDLREGFFSVPHQTCITKDNAPTDIDFLVYYKVVDPKSSVINVQDFKAAALGLATTTLRAVVGDITLDETLAQRDRINHILRAKLDEVTERWGVKITSVEIREIKPPADVQDAMIRQMSAERNRRAMVTEAEGKKEAAIRVAEGEKQAAILKAEGERQAAILKAEGYAIALKTIFEVAREIDPKTLSLQYLETLKSIAGSPATKIVLPLEFTSLIKPIAGLAERAASGSKGD